MKAEVHFLGQPEIFIDRKKIQVTQKKVEAMLLYLLFNGNCTRNELTALFWCDCDEESARRNLRNSLYRIRKLFGRDFLQTVGNTYIKLNPEVLIERDTDLFIAENSEMKILELTDFCFLDKYYLKNCGEFEAWVRCMQNTYERILIEKLLPAMRLAFKKGDYVLAEKYAKCILRVDVHNEETAHILMKICGKNADYNRGVLIYTQYTEELYKNLGLRPGAAIVQEYENILRLKLEMIKSETKGPFYVGHMKALAALQEEYHKYCRREVYNSCVICGSEGMGKKDVWWEFSRDCKDVDTIKVWFQNLNSAVDYYAIRHILIKIAEWLKIPQEDLLTAAQGENADLFFMNRIEWLYKRLQNSKKRCLLMIHNLEFVDEKSMSLILSSLLERVKKEIFVTAGFCQNFKKKFSAFSWLPTLPQIRMIELKPLRDGECSRYVKACLSEGRAVEQEERELYRYTGGNLLLLREVASNIENGAPDIYSMNSKANQRFNLLFQSFADREYEYMEYLAVMENGVEAEALSAMLHESPLLVMQELNLLMSGEFLDEINQKGHERVRIQSKMIRDMIYNNISGFKRNELHKIALQYYESVFQWEKRDLFFLSELKYHSLCTNRAGDSLYYDVAYLRYILDYYDEFFPAVPQDVEILQNLVISRKETYQNLQELKLRLDSLEDEMEPSRFSELQMELLYLKGRTLNRDGKRDQGLIFAQNLINMAAKSENKKMLLNGYIEALCYGVKAEDSVLMDKYLKEVKMMEELSFYQVEYGKILRLESYRYILDEEYGKAEELLKESIRIFSSPKLQNIYYYCAAGAYDYLAITYRCRGQYVKAQEAMEKALKLCTGRNTRKGLDLFYEDYAYILYLQGKPDEAETYFLLSAQIYDDYGTYWLRSIGESCMAIIHLDRGDDKAAVEHFRRAEIFSRKEKTREELDVLTMARRKLQKAKLLI